MLLPASAVLVTPRQCHLVLRTLHEAARKVTDAGMTLDPDFASLLGDVRRAAEEYQRLAVSRASDVGVTPPAVSAPIRRTLTPDEVSLLLRGNPSPHGVRAACRRGDLRATKRGRLYEIDETDLLEWQAKRAS